MGGQLFLLIGQATPRHQPLLIPFSRPLDLTSTLESGQAFRWVRDDSRRPEQPRWYTGVIFGNIMRIRQVPGGVEFLCGPDADSYLKPLVRSYLGLDDDLETTYSSIGVEGRIGAAIERFRGMRILRQDPWECLISFICSANSNIPRISANVEDMSRSFGRPIRFETHTRNTFPSPQELASAGEERLRGLGLGFRAKYVAKTAAIVVGGGIDLMALREVSYDEALPALTALPGVGDKVANCVMLFSLDKPEAFPVDVWIKRAIEDWYAEETHGKTSRSDMRAWAQRRFGQYAGYANQYMFHGRRLQGKTG